MTPTLATCPVCGRTIVVKDGRLRDHVPPGRFADKQCHLEPAVKTDAIPQVIHLARYEAGNVPGMAVSVCGRMVRKPTSAEMFRLVSQWCATCREAATDD